MPSKSIKSLVLVLLLAAGSWAQQGPKLEIIITDTKVNQTEAELKGGSVTHSPGDTIEYVLTSKNVGDALMTEPTIVDPIPAGVTYIPKSATGNNAEILFSIDGGATYGSWPMQYSVRNSRGIILKREATPEMYTHIKWRILENIPPGGAHISTFKVMVNP
jgi:uncharacterized repeat protein (TIGR01451 family)